jgi:hypothetical protein
VPIMLLLLGSRGTRHGLADTIPAYLSGTAEDGFLA